MAELLIQLLLLAGVVGIGYGLRRTNLVTLHDGQRLQKLLFYVGLPILIFTSVNQAQLNPGALLIWWFPIGLSLLLLGLATLYFRSKTPLAALQNPLTLSSIIFQTSLLIPIVYTLYDSSVLARFLVLDLGFAIILIALANLIIAKNNSTADHFKEIISKITAAPAVWALAVGLLLSQFAIALPEQLLSGLDFISGIVPSLILLSAGILLQPTLRALQWQHLLVFLVRVLLATLLASAAWWILALENVYLHLFILAAIAPIGLNALWLGKRLGGDQVATKAHVTASLLCFVVILPVALYGLQLWWPV